MLYLIGWINLWRIKHIIFPMLKARITFEGSYSHLGEKVGFYIKKEMKKKDFSSNDESKIAFCFLKSFHKNKVKQLVCTELVSQNVSLFLRCT